MNKDLFSNTSGYIPSDTTNTTINMAGTNSITSSQRSQSQFLNQNNNERKTKNKNYEDLGIEEDNQARFEQIFKITTPHSSRSYSVANSVTDVEPTKNTNLNTSNALINDFRNSPELKLKIPQPNAYNNSHNDMNKNKIKKKNKNKSIVNNSNENNDNNVDEIQKAIQKLIQKREMPPIEILPQVYRIIKTLYLNSLIVQDYDRANELEEVSKLVGDNYECMVNAKIKAEQTKTLETRIELAKKRLQIEIDEWDKILHIFKNEQNKQRHNLEQKILEERNEFENNWSNPEYLIQFNKPSPTLLQLRKQQKALAIAKRFADAKQVKQIADKLQQIESDQAQQRAVSCMKLHYNKMIDDQQRTIECFNDHEKRLEQYLVAEREKVLKPYYMLIKQLEATRDKDLPLNMKPQKVVFVSNIRTKILKTDRALPPASPRTTRAMSKFRNSDEPERLTLTGIDVRRTLSGRRAKSSVRVSKVRK
ncbi:hypothetical protein TRFO_26048 [Tritrichomonas foetus]|uniref:Uncharacterized protein n=1 Tax=Tritrichomonas foetus TaxID=1144522 RepID=A0A1J4K3G6_9EUKA|nr:hypothetical protein TRFO_26048 [Tritrichomonas foetus]|eukprot:OHT05985.1 hypothetical protein TRFO_26048 [Tritrichomonas foetus]